MDISTRKAAQQKNEPTYFTGSPCINGHLTYRYTQSGTCAGCIKANHQPAISQMPRIDRSWVGDLIQFRARLWDKDVDLFRSMVFGAALLRQPEVRMSDLWKNEQGSGRHEKTAIYRFNCFPPDLETLQKAALDIFRASIASAQLPPPKPSPFEPEAEYWPTDDPR